MQPSGNRPSFESIYMQLAQMLSKRSTCSRLQVGAVISSPDFREIFSIGFNGGPVGGFNECQSLSPGQCLHTHAEDNACNFAPARIPKIMFVTHQPCAACAVRIVNKLGFEKIYYLESYRDVRGIEILAQAGIQIEQLKL